MTKFDLHKKFDAVVCRFGVIFYVKTYDNLKKAIRAFLERLKPGGVTILEPHFVKPNEDKSLSLKYEHILP